MLRAPSATLLQSTTDLMRHQRFTTVKTVADQFGDQPQFKCDSWNDVSANCNLDVVLPRVRPDALGCVGTEHPLASLSRASARARRRSARSPSVRRSRKSASTLWWKPGSSSSMVIAYLKSMRQRTASAACRSDRLSRNCNTQTVASWAGERPGRPSRGYQPAKSSSHHSPSSRSRTHIAVVPSGLLARAICAVRVGTCPPERGRSDNGHLDGLTGTRNSPEHAR